MDHLNRVGQATAWAMLAILLLGAAHGCHQGWHNTYIGQDHAAPRNK